MYACRGEEIRRASPVQISYVGWGVSWTNTFCHYPLTNRRSLIWGRNSDLRVQTDIPIQSEAEEDVEAQDRIEPLIPGRNSDNSQDFLTRKVFKNIKFRLPPRSRLTLGHCILYLRPLLRDPKIKPPDNDDALLYYYNCPPSFYSVVTANRMPFQWFLVAPRSPCFVPSQKFDRRKGEFEHDPTLLSPWSNSIRYHREEWRNTFLESRERDRDHRSAGFLLGRYPERTRDFSWHHGVVREREKRKSTNLYQRLVYTNFFRSTYPVRVQQRHGRKRNDQSSPIL